MVRNVIAAVDATISKHLMGDIVSPHNSKTSSAQQRKPLVTAAHWDVAPFPAAQRLLGIAPLPSSTATPSPFSSQHDVGSTPCDVALIVMVKDAVADIFFGAQTILDASDDLGRRVRRFLTPGATALAEKPKGDESEGGALQVDVAKMLAMGKSLMTKGQAVYAEKFFVKALGVLDAIGNDELLARTLSSDDNFLLSLADCLAWVLMSQLVQGKNIEHNAAADRLEAEHGPLVGLTPYPTNGDVQRALSARKLFRFAPAAWSPELCSVKTLSALLAATPSDHKSRSLLVITLFLSNDVERCLTEALKLQVLGHDFGAIALSAVSDFLGADHELVQRLGWKS
ncbi:Hypothetical protein, putative [Bodo saltans]|uniref:Uncharacterized protein n=1 Tax=Bodo saltans TaxID=75058 RepID=A0A0S4J7D9_BODSA|nr:Hypothetical protein, putative [Bodo saltans]|eukprot:CUG55709.1 Hypothetical protein, putative [Bodo saltans]